MNTTKAFPERTAMLDPTETDTLTIQSPLCDLIPSDATLNLRQSELHVILRALRGQMDGSDEAKAAGIADRIADALVPDNWDAISALGIR
jgi:hypothetical protein